MMEKRDSDAESRFAIGIRPGCVRRATVGRGLAGDLVIIHSHRKEQYP